MTTHHSLEELETLDQIWTDAFAKDRGWEEHVLQDPVGALDVFFRNIPGTKMLDVGCGWGRYVHRFVEQDLDYTGLDLSGEMLKVAQRTNPGLSFIHGSFRQMPFPPDNFDGLWNCCSLSAVPKAHLVSILAEHHRVLKPGGVMMIVMPSLMDSYEELHRNNDGSPSAFRANYFHDEFLGYIAETEFTVVSAENHEFSFGAMSVLMRK